MEECLVRPCDVYFQFDLSGCEKLTDNTFAVLHTLNKDGHTWSMKCTGVNYMNNTNIGIETKGCPSYGSKYLVDTYMYLKL